MHGHRMEKASWTMALALWVGGQDAPSPETRKLTLTVERCVDLALQNNHDLKALEYGAEAAAAGIEQARGSFDPLFTSTIQGGRGTSNFNPQGTPVSVANETQAVTAGLSQALYTGGSYSLSFSAERSKTFPTGIDTDPNYDVRLRLSVSQPLLRGGWTSYNKAGLAAAAIAREQSDRSFDENAQSTIYSVHAAYWDLLFAIQDLEVKKFSLQLGERLLEINRKKVEEGVSAPVEVLQAETEIAVRREALITAENSLKAAEDSLRQLIFPFRHSGEWEFEIVPSSELPSPERTEERDWEKVIERAFRSRPDLERLRLELRAKELDLQTAENELLPRLDLTATRTNLGLDTSLRDSIDSVSGTDFPSYFLVLSLEVPLGNLAAKGKFRAAQANLAVAREQLHSRENLVSREVRDAIRNLHFQKERIAASKKSRELAEKQLEAEERKFEVGLSTNFQVLEFQQQLVGALSNEKAALLDYAKALVNLEKAQGTLQP